MNHDPPTTDASLTCPDCRADLSVVTSGEVRAHRCGQCRGVWLDPQALQRVCEREEGTLDEQPALPPARGAGPRQAPPAAEDRVRYRPCPHCRDVMSRTNFAKVSGVVIDVCRPHGAWFDRGELAAIRRFLRDGGLRRYGRHQRLGQEVSASPRHPRAARVDDVYDLLVGGGGSWDVPSRIPRLLVAGGFAAIGGWSLWLAFDPGHSNFRGFGAGSALVGVICLSFAWRAIEQWLSGRRP